VPTITGAAFGLAVIASIDALLGAKLAAHPGDPKLDGDRLLMRLGVGNAAAALAGGITSGTNIGASEVNRAFGGRTAISVVVHCAALLAVAALLLPAIEYVPRVVLSAVLMVIAVQHVDRWTLRHVGRLASGSSHFRLNITLELLVMLVVAVLSIAVSIVLAVFVGVAIAVVLFLLRMSRSVIRREYRCNDVHSRKSRAADDMRNLEAEGGRILVMELNGVLFFGSAEKLANAIADAMAQETHYVILDLRRVTDIDNTGSQILIEIQDDIAPQRKHLIFALAAKSETAAQLAEFGVLESVTAGKVFPDVDRAIEWAEDDLLRSTSRHAEAERELVLDRVSLFAGFTPEEVAAIGKHVSRATYSPGSAVFREGDPGTDMFIVMKGTASAHIRQDDGGDIRLVTFAPGTVFGELAILDKGNRSATVVADNELICHVLSETNFAALSAQSPAVAIKLLANLGRELSGRLRLANQTIHQLEV
jgi:anti-anti-sigma regulatory factor